MRTLHFQPQARLDLLEIYNYILQDDIRAANQVGARLEDEIQDLARLPQKGHRRKDIRDPRFLAWGVYRYVIVYRYDAESVTIVRVVHGVRDFRKLF